MGLGKNINKLLNLIIIYFILLFHKAGISILMYYPISMFVYPNF